MKTIYALPCTCGKSVDVDQGLAGLKVQCSCGREVEVPTIRGLARLETRTAPAAVRSSNWGPRQGVIFLGLTIMALALGLFGWLRFFEPNNPIQGVNPQVIAAELDAMTITQTFQIWSQLNQGLDRDEWPIIVKYREDLARRQRWAWVALGVAGCGLVVALISLLMPQNSGARHRRRVPAR